MSSLVPATTLRRSFAIGAAVLLTLLGAGCGSDTDDKASGSTTTTEPATEQTTGDGEGAATDTSTTEAPDPEEFDRGMAKMTDGIESANGDLCKLIAVLQDSATVGNPANSGQAKQAYEVIESMLNSIADAAPAESAADAEVIRKGVAAMMSTAEKSDYSMSEFNTGGPASINTPEFGTALSGIYLQASKKCGLTTPGAPGASTPETAPAG